MRKRDAREENEIGRNAGPRLESWRGVGGAGPCDLKPPTSLTGTGRKILQKNRREGRKGSIFVKEKTPYISYSG